MPEMIRLLILIPTRNRAELAVRAIGSVLNTHRDSVRVVVSDNSTDELQKAQLQTFAASCCDVRLALQHPPEPMTMTHHWAWALERAIDRTDASHVVVLTDRMVFKRHGLADLLRVIAEHSFDIVSYNHDRVIDHRTPVSAELQPWSDKVFTLLSSRLLRLSADCVFPQALPRLLNCVVPAQILREVRQKCGNVVSSTAPDHNFAYRALGLFDTIAYWDRAPIVHYALERSNGESTARGIVSPDNANFFSLIDGVPFASAPIPGMRTIGNAVLHEYCVAQAELCSGKFPPIEAIAYANMIAKELEVMENRPLAAEMTAMLKQYKRGDNYMLAVARQSPRPVSALRRVARALGLGRILLRVSQLFAVREPEVSLRTTARVFDDPRAALEYALRSDGEMRPSAPQLAFLLR